jgi:DNA-binding CsgD family transcriptional regulator
LVYCVLINMAKTLWILIFPSLLAIINLTEGKAQPAGKPLVINYNKLAYGGGNQSWSIAVNTQGIVYAGNDNGLLEFDGSNWHLYAMPENAVVRSVAVLGDSVVYVGSYEEFGYWKPGWDGALSYHSLSREFLNSADLHNDEIWRIIPYHGKIYFQSFSTIFVFNGKDIKIIKPQSSVVLLMMARDRLFIHMVDHGLCELVNDSLQLIPGSELLANDEIKVMLPFGETQFLVGASSGGLFIFDGKKFAPWNMPVNEQIRAASINNGLRAGNLLAIGTIAEGIFILDAKGNLLEHLATANFLQNNTVLSLGLDNKNNIWAGLDRGIDFINFHAGLDFYVDPSGTMGSVYAAVEDGTSLLIGTNHGLYRYAFVTGTGYTDPVQMESVSGQVWDLGTIDHQVFCGYNEGTSIIRGNKSVPVSDVNGGFKLMDIPGTEGRYQLQSTYSPLVIYEKSKGEWKLLHIVEGFFEPLVQFEFDHFGNIWAVHFTRGVFKIHLNENYDSIQSNQYYGRNKGFPTERGLTLAKVENRIVFSTGKEIYTWDDLRDTIIPFTQLNNQVGEFRQASQIISASNHHYWFLKDNQVAYFHVDANTFEKIFQYDLSLQGMYLGTRYMKIVPLNDSIHLICLDNGFALFNTSKGLPSPQPGIVKIRNIYASSTTGKTIQYQVIPRTKPIHIRHSFRNISFRFASNDGYKYPLYRHRLEGLEDKWSDWHSSSLIDYKRLPAGEYIFNVEAKNIFGLPGHIQSISFTIRPPWYVSLPSIGFYIIFFIMGVALINMIFQRRLRIHRSKIEKEEREKREKQILLAEQELIRLKNEKLQAEIEFKSAQLADYTMNMIRKNEELIKIREKLVEQKAMMGVTKQADSIERIINLVDNELTSKDDWKSYAMHFDQAHHDFLKRLKSTYPDLTQSDLKLCAYLRLNLSSKEIAPLLNITIRAVEIHRYRLRKRLNMSTEENLVKFLLSF